MELEIIGAIKVKDGLFIGDEYAAQDLEFVVANKVTRIINCAARQIPNHWEPIGVAYLSLYWLDQDSQILFEPKEEMPDAIFKFIEEAQVLGESVLVHSVRGQSRCIAVVALFLMLKFRWALFKALEFLNSRRPDIDLRHNFVTQLGVLENFFTRQGRGPVSSKWTDMNEHTGNTEELILRNTFLNAQMGPIEDYERSYDINKEFKLVWADRNTGEVTKLVDIHHPGSKNPVENGYAILKSCLKGIENEYRAPLSSIKNSSNKAKLRADLMYLSGSKIMPKNLDSALEYGSSSDSSKLPVKKPRNTIPDGSLQYQAKQTSFETLPKRPSSASRRENSPSNQK
jgi:protein-tyrosine phosphatase